MPCGRELYKNSSMLRRSNRAKSPFGTAILNSFYPEIGFLPIFLALERPALSARVLDVNHNGLVDDFKAD